MGVVLTSDQTQKEHRKCMNAWILVTLIWHVWIFQCLGNFNLTCLDFSMFREKGANCYYSTTRSSSKFFRVGYEQWFENRVVEYPRVPFRPWSWYVPAVEEGKLSHWGWRLKSSIHILKIKLEYWTTNEKNLEIQQNLYYIELGAM